MCIRDRDVSDTAPDEGDTIIYTLQVTNNGPDPATNAVVSDVLPSGVTYVSHSGGTYDSGTGVWTVGNLAVGVSSTLRITTTVDPGTAGQTITNTAVITDADQGDTVPGNNQDDAAITVTEIDLEMSKDVDNVYVETGDTIVYTLQVTNNGPDDASGVVISDTLPTGVTYSSDDGDGDYDDTTGAWTVPGTLGLGGSATLRITATVDAGTEGSTITNTAIITDSDQADTVAGNDQDGAIIVVPLPTDAELEMRKTVNPLTPEEGDTIIYTLEVVNNGPGNTTGVVVSDTLPSGVTYVLSLIHI